MIIKKQALEEEEGSVTQTVYGDLITFVAMLFILLFILTYQEKKTESLLTELRIQFGGETKDPTEEVTAEALYVSQIQGWIQKEQLEEDARVLIDEQKIKLRLSSPILYDSGKATLKPEGIKILKTLLPIIQNVKNPIIVEGHTDNVPIARGNKEFESNWDLSFHRSYSALKFLLSTQKFTPKQLSGIGYGEYHPVVPNDSDINRRRNRRIEINLIRVSMKEAQAG